MAEFSAVIELKYNNTKGHMETGYLSLSNTSVVSKADSHCGENETRLVIVINGDLSNTLTFVVEKKNNKYFVRDVLFEADENSIKDLIPLAPTEKKIAAEMVNQTLFEAPATKSYLCKTQEHYKMTSEVKDKFEVTLDMKDVRFDAFRTSGDSYRDGQLCSDDTKISDTVPIIVGAALAALVVIVLIAYFIGRRRSRRLAYQSV
ncbi:lysosome-associated membrane glycoprotein 1-like protein [Leptotrombidium deliense]|uniref:Lysosome-associated membrane glycoprotein 5 n=1 Tax=Leptotrombidium deliense TaxID=299467 RepID=A0A443SWM4_9ACAR|nr:lysosome-associated membrane glycoprotein 1-like protein [Leptotrombidium deliense]